MNKEMSQQQPTTTDLKLLKLKYILLNIVL